MPAQEAAQNAEINYKLATRFYSFTMLERRLGILLADCFGEVV